MAEENTKTNVKDHATLEAQIRLTALERAVEVIQNTAKEAHELATRQVEKMDSLLEWQRRQNGDIDAASAAVDRLSRLITDKMDGLRDQLIAVSSRHDTNLESVCRGYDEKIETLSVEMVKQQLRDRNRLVAIMGTVITGLIITLVGIRIGF